MTQFSHKIIFIGLRENSSHRCYCINYFFIVYQEKIVREEICYISQKVTTLSSYAFIISTLSIVDMIN